MIRTVMILLAHDLAVACKNKTFLLVAGIPLFVYATLAFVDPTDVPIVPSRIALLEADTYAASVLQGVTGAPDHVSIRWVANAGEATRLLQAREIDGFLSRDESDAERVRLTVVQRASPETLHMVQRLSELQIEAEGGGKRWLAAITPLQPGSLQRLTLPTWILMMVLLVGFIVLPAQVAEEKEKQWLLGWLQTPVRESEWLVAKLAYANVLVLAAVAGLSVMAGWPSRGLCGRYLAVICAGGFCFGALGVCLGLLCRNQASARTLGVVCYLPLLLPAALSDMSQGLRNIAPLIPSYHLHEPIRVMLLEDRIAAGFNVGWMALVALGVAGCLASHHLIRRRWLM